LWNPQVFVGDATSVIYDGSPLQTGYCYYVSVRVSDGYIWSDWQEIGFCYGDRIQPITIDPDSLTLNTGESAELTVTGGLTPITWSVSDSSICNLTTVNERIVGVEAISSGSTTLTATDYCGYQSQAQMTAVDPNQAPVAVCQDVTLATDPGTCSAAETSVDNGSYDPDGDAITIEQSHAGSFPLGTTEVTLTVTDSSGASASCTAIVTVLDTELPSISAPADVTVTQAGGGDTPVDLGTPTVSDNCNPPTPAVTNDGPAAFPLGATTVTWTATDTSGNSATDTQTVTVESPNQAPVAVCQDVTEATDPSVCSTADASVDNGSYDPDGDSITIEQSHVGSFPLGTTEVTLTVTDNSGASDSCTAVVTVQDTEPPSITAPADVTVAETVCGNTPVDLGTPTVSDNCNPPGPTVSNDAPAGFALGSTTVNWTATDTSGNSATDTQIATVMIPNQPPVAVCQDVTVATDAGVCTTAVASVDGGSYDPDGDPINIAQSHVGSFPIGTTEVTLTVTDVSGASAFCLASVTVQDTEPPAIVAPADVTVAQVGCGETTVDLGTPVVSDNCNPPGPTVTNDAPAGFALGSTTVNWTATDNSGNSATDTQIVTVVPEGLGEENISELVNNLNFEANQPPAGFTINENGAYIKSATGWTISETGGTWQPTAPFPNGVPEGTNVGFVNPGTFMYQQIQGVTIASGTTYMVDLSVGWRDTDDEFGYTVQLLAGSIDGNILAEITAIDFMPIRGDFTLANISYTDDGTQAGQSLFIKLGSLANTRPVFDAVPVTDSSTPDGLVNNLNFETDQPPEGFTSNVNGDYIKSATGWTISETGGTWQPTAPFPNGVPEGTNVGFVNEGAFMYQQIQGVTIASGTTYTVDLSVGWRDTDDEFGYTVQLLAGSINGDILAEISEIDFNPIRGGFVSATISYTADGTYAGQSLFIKLGSLANTRPVFDARAN